MNAKKSGYSIIVVILIIAVLVVLGIKGVQKAFNAAIKAGEKEDKTGTRALAKGYVQDGVEGFQAAMAQNANDKALAEAVRKADAGAVRMLLGAGANPNTRTASSSTPLHRAAAWGLVDIARMLLDHEANVNALNSKSITPLHQAAGNGHGDMVELLIDYDANINPKNDDGHTPVAMALQGLAAADPADADSRRRYEKTIDLLRSWGAK